MGYGGGLLHSHIQTYPVGSQQQQVTCYHYKDENNEWVVTPTWEDPPLSPDGELRFLKHGDQLRLVHHSTGRNLHSHNVVAPVSKLNNEVSAYGNATVGDSNDYWVVEVVDDFLRGGRAKVDRIHSLSTRLRLKHLNNNCYLRAANAILPQWGFKQVEVSCDKNNDPADEHTYWNIESHWNDRRSSSPSAPSRHADPSAVSSSSRRRPKALPLALLPRLLAPQRRHDDLEQRARARLGQGGLDRVQAVRLAVPLERHAHERLAGQRDQVLPHRERHRVVVRQHELDRVGVHDHVALCALPAQDQRLCSW